MDITQADTTTKCFDMSTLMAVNGQVLENQDGSVSVYVPNNLGVLTPVILTKQCCEFLSSKYFFDINSQTCKWSDAPSCTLDNVFKIVLNPNGNDGSIFYSSSNVNENCVLTIDFDYLFKIKCETLSGIMTGSIVSSPVVIETANQNTQLQSQLQEQSVICESITNTINNLNAEILLTPYSITCELQPILATHTDVSDSSLMNFGRTGFGPIGNSQTTRTTSGESQSSAVVNGKTYCLREPEGLSAWANILGPINYQRFLNGDPTSYTCEDVQAIVDQNTLSRVSLLGDCTIPFGTRTSLMNQLSDLIDQQIACNALVDSLTAQLANSGTTFTETIISCTRPIDMFEALDVSMVVDIITSANTLQTVYTGDTLFQAIGAGNLYTYLTSHPISGFYVCGDPSSSETTFSGCTPLNLNLVNPLLPNVYICDSVLENLAQDLYIESGLSGSTNGLNIFSGSIPNGAFASKWLHYTTTISDPIILSQIRDQKITISLKINHTCGEFCILLDNIFLNKVCTNVDRNDLFVSQSPGFELDRIRDNKKSWSANTVSINRDFLISNDQRNFSIRQTNYDVNDERLVINSKEVDLDVSLASAIETDVWTYLVDNPCLLTGATFCDPCIGCDKEFQDDLCYDFMDGEIYDFMDTSGTSGTTICCGDNRISFDSLLTQPLSAITVVEDFEYFMTSELIDAKNRQTISGYPTLRALYDRYMTSSMYCDTNSSHFDYLTMEQFADLLGNYWVDIVEQVIPSTTIWGSVKIYSNTIFDQQKFKYRAYSSLLCGNPFSGDTVLSPINGTNGECASVDVSYVPLTTLSGPNLRLRPPISTTCDSLCLAQMNHGSEFIGTVTIINEKVLGG